MSLGFQERHFPVQVAPQILNAATSFEVANTEHSIRPEGAGVVLQKAPRPNAQDATVETLILDRANIPLGDDAITVCVFDVQRRFKMRVLALWPRTSKFDRELPNSSINRRKVFGRCFLGGFLVLQNLAYPYDSQNGYTEGNTDNGHDESKDAAKAKAKYLPVLVNELSDANRELAKRKYSFWLFLLDMLFARARFLRAACLFVSPKTTQPPEQRANDNQYQGRKRLHLEVVGQIEQPKYCCSENNKRCQAENGQPNEAEKSQHKNNLQKYWGQDLAKAQKRQSLHLTNRTNQRMIPALLETEGRIETLYRSRRPNRAHMRGFLRPDFGLDLMGWTFGAAQADLGILP